MKKKSTGVSFVAGEFADPNTHLRRRPRQADDLVSISRDSCTHRHTRLARGQGAGRLPREHTARAPVSRGPESSSALHTSAAHPSPSSLAPFSRGLRPHRSVPREVVE